MVFPKETEDLIQRDIDVMNAEWSKQKKADLVHAYAAIFNESKVYGFRDSLREGLYAPYNHEMREKLIGTYNCTSIIPTLYLYLERTGSRCEIVQFAGFKDASEAKRKKNKSKDRASHFALIVDAGKKKPYLVDPFYAVCGPILENSPGKMRVGKLGSFAATTRVYDSMVYFPVERFAEMMDRLHDPAESLDVLVAGQKVYSGRKYVDTNCVEHIYYNDDANELITRLYASQPLLSDRAIFCKQELDDSGETIRTGLEFFMAKDYQWDALVDGKQVADTTFEEARKIRRILRQLVEFDKKARIGPALMARKNEEKTAVLMDMADVLMGRVDLDAIQPQVLARTLYETERPRAKHLFSQHDRDRRILDKNREQLAMLDAITPNSRTLFLHGWKLKKLERNQARNLRDRRKRLERRNSKLVEELNALNNLRFVHRRSYDRLIDKFLFSQTLTAKPDALQARVDERGVDPRIGYLAMVADFLPYVFKAKKEITLEIYMPDIRKRVAARRAKMSADIEIQQDRPDTVDVSEQLLSM